MSILASDESDFLWEKASNSSSSSESDNSIMTKNKKSKKDPSDVDEATNETSADERKISKKNLKSLKGQKRKHRSSSNTTTESTDRHPKKLKLDSDSNTSHKHRHPKIKQESSTDDSDIEKLLKRKVKQEIDSLNKSNIKKEKEAKEAITNGDIQSHRKKKKANREPSNSDQKPESDGESEKAPAVSSTKVAKKRKLTNNSVSFTEPDLVPNINEESDTPVRKKKRKTTGDWDQKVTNGVFIRDRVSVCETVLEQPINQRASTPHKPCSERISKYAETLGLEPLQGDLQMNGDFTLVKGAGRSGTPGPQAVMWIPGQGVMSVPSVRASRRVPRPSTSVPTFAPAEAPPKPPTTTDRHPLLGHDYRRLLKVPAAIKAKLKEQPQKTSKASVSEVEATVEDPPKKKKKSKRQKDQKDLWDSETAIEQNLFNF